MDHFILFMNYSQMIENISNEAIYHTNKIYRDYFFIPENIDQNSNEYMPILLHARDKIVFLSRTAFYYKDYANIQLTLYSKNNTLIDVPIGFLREVKDKGGCTNNAFDKNDKACDLQIDKNFRCQDFYNLGKERKMEEEDYRKYFNRK